MDQRMDRDVEQYNLHISFRSGLRVSAIDCGHGTSRASITFDAGDDVSVRV